MAALCSTLAALVLGLALLSPVTERQPASAHSNTYVGAIA